MTEHRQKLVLARISLGQLPRRGFADCSAASARCRSTISRSITLDVARDPARGASNRTRVSAAAQHETDASTDIAAEPRGRRHHQAGCQLRQRAEDEQNAPTTRHSPRDGHSAAPISTRSRTGRSRCRATHNRVRASRHESSLHGHEAWSPRSARAALAQELRWSRKRDQSVQERHLPRRGSNRDAGIILSAAVPRRQSNVLNSHILSASRTSQVETASVGSTIRARCQSDRRAPCERSRLMTTQIRVHDRRMLPLTDAASNRSLTLPTLGPLTGSCPLRHRGKDSAP